MKIIVTANIFAPSSFGNMPGINLKILEGTFELMLDARSLREILRHGQIPTHDIYTLFLDKNVNGEFIDIDLCEDRNVLIIKCRKGYFHPAPVETIGEKIKELVAKGWKLVLTEKQNREWTQYPIQELFI